MINDFVEPVAAHAPASAAAAAAAGIAAAIPASFSPAARVEARRAEHPAGPPMDARTQADYDEAVRRLRGGRAHEAERAFLRLLVQRPDVAGVHANLGLVYRRLGRADAAAAELEEALRITPRNAGYHNQLGLTWRMLGRFDHARRAYETAIAIDPSHGGALINLAILHDQHLGEPARAAELYARGAALLPAQASMVNTWLTELKNRKADPKALGEPAVAGVEIG